MKKKFSKQVTLKAVKSLATVALACATWAPLNVSAQNETQTSSSTFPKTSPVSSMAQMRPHIGASVGAASPTDDYDNSSLFGLDFGFQPYVPFGVGAMLSTAKFTGKNGKGDLTRTTLLARGSYNFGGNIPVIQHSYVALGIGPVFNSDGTELGIAPIAGFDIPLTRDVADKVVSLGANVKYLATSGGSPEDVSLNGAVKYWY
jgi:hypothetical protein